MVDNNLDKYTIIVEEQDNYTIELNEQGPQGLRGPQGEVGPVGPQGEAATISIGTVTTGAEGSNATVTNSGTQLNAVLDFEIPRGDKGDTGPQGISVTGVEEISKIGLVSTYRMTFSNGEYFDYEVTDGSIDGLTREEIINIIGYEPASYTSVEGLTTRVSTLEERVEDLTASKFPNVVIVGTPHIEGGQVSGYSNTNYLQFPFVDISRGLPFDIYFSFTTGSDVTTQQNILDSYFGIALAIQNSKGIMALSSNGASWDIGNVTGTNTILPNTTYYAKCSWTGTQYNASLSTNDTTYIPDMVLNSTLTTNKTTIFIGGSPDLFGEGTAHPFKGTINFNKSRVDVQGATVWEGMADVGLASRANVSLNNLDEVGEKRFTDIQVALDGKQDKGTSGSGLEICDIGMALYIDETKGLRRYLNGQIVDINANTQAFLDRLKQIQTTNPDYFTTENNWQAETLLNIDGCVYKFVLNYADDGETVISVRLPKYPDYVEVNTINSTAPVSVYGNGMTLGLTNGTLNSGLQTWNDAKLVSYTLSYGTHINSRYSSGGTLVNDGQYSSLGITTDPTKSGIVGTANLSTAQTKLKLRYFIQIATGSETQNNIVNDIELNNPYSFGKGEYSKTPKNSLSWLASNGQWNPKGTYPAYYDWILENVNNGVADFKRSTDTYDDYSWVINTSDETFRLPLLDGSEDIISDKCNDLVLSSSGSTYTAPANGWFTFRAHSQSAGSEFQIYNQANGLFDIGWDGNVSGNEISAWLPFKKGQDALIFTSGAFQSDSWYQFRFIYAKGNGTLYYYVGETVQNANLIDAGRIGEQLVGKVNTNASNFTSEGRSLIASYAMPTSINQVDIAIPADGTFITADKDCLLNMLAQMTSSIGMLEFVVYDPDGNVVNQVITPSTASNYYIAVWTLLPKGYRCRITYNGINPSTGLIRKRYLKGSI